MPSNYEVGYADGQASAVDALVKFSDRAAKDLAAMTADRDEWKRQHDLLVEVRRADLAALDAKLKALQAGQADAGEVKL